VTIRDVIERRGHFAHRGDPDASIEAWEETGFKAGEVDEWLSARCLDPDAAEDMDDLGITIEMAAMRTGAGNGGYVDTVGYQVAAGDLGLEEAGELSAFVLRARQMRQAGHATPISRPSVVATDADR
jgi:hypothetical protein